MNITHFHDFSKTYGIIFSRPGNNFFIFFIPWLFQVFHLRVNPVYSDQRLHLPQCMLILWPVNERPPTARNQWVHIGKLWGIDHIQVCEQVSPRPHTGVLYQVCSSKMKFQSFAIHNLTTRCRQIRHTGPFKDYDFKLLSVFRDVLTRLD